MAKEIVFFNGRFMPADAVRLPIDSEGILCGVGIFETMRAYRGRIIGCAAHLHRLYAAARLINLAIPYNRDTMAAFVRKTAGLNARHDSVVRLTVWEGTPSVSILIRARRYNPYAGAVYQRGFRACVSEWRIDAGSALCGLKTTSYLPYRWALRRAQRSGFDEALLLTRDGYISEGSRSNIFFRRGENVYTPSLACGCRAGVTRSIVCRRIGAQRMKLEEGAYYPDDVCRADEAFLTNSLMGIMPLVRLVRRRIGRGIPGPLTRACMKRYENLLCRGISDARIDNEYEKAVGEV